ncbi:MAG: DUF3618 domain-containing protein [Brevundimonas sp.]
MNEAKEPAPFSTPQMVLLEAEAKLKRLELASTVDAIAARLTPRALLGEAVSEAKEAVGNVRDHVSRLFRDATSPDADPEASTRARAIVAGVATVVTLVVAASLLKRRGGRQP